ncbi:MAG: hypothetical protein LBM98_00580 [Oscillospiraceae bacterium]|jgi:hypothetical protein|nr:hypothetical protein [Oscillospiraceae bacterium]
MAIIINDAAGLSSITSGNSYVLGGDIDVPYSWTQPNTYLDNVSLDGAGYSLSSLYSSLFININNSSVSNLTVNRLYAPLIGDGHTMQVENILIGGGTLNGGGQGALAGALWNSDVVNVVNYAEIFGNDTLGGLIGVCDSCRITDCINYANIHGDSGTVYETPLASVGGLVGHFQIETNFEDAPADYGFFNCKNFGDVTGYSTVGGLVGFLINDKRQYENFPRSTFRIIGCENHGSVSPTAAAIGGLYGDVHYGGILGFAIFSMDEISNCLNTGAISGGGCVGGIAGETSNIYTYLDPDVLLLDINRVINCVNRGAITLNAADVPPTAPDPFIDYRYAGGIVGSMRYLGSVIDCLNEAPVISNAEGTGGIVGYLLTGTISGNENTGEVRGTLNTGGIVGEISRFVPDEEHILPEDRNIAIVENNRSAALTFGTRSDAGGIVGLANNGVVINNNRACGAVQSEQSYAGGITGFVQVTDSPRETFIENNLAANPYVRAISGVARVLGGKGSTAVVTLNNATVSGSILLTGAGPGGVTYDNQPVSPSDTELGATRMQGGTAKCADGEHFEGCNGCVPDNCPPGYHWQDGSGCVQDTPKPPEPRPPHKPHHCAHAPGYYHCAPVFCVPICKSRCR